MRLTAEWWDARAREQKGFHKVMNTGIPLPECLAETTRQADMLYELPLPWGRARYLLNATGVPYRTVVDTPSTMTVLDVGCGVGRLSSIVAGWAQEVVGLDWSRAMLDIAVQNYTDIKFILGEATNSRQFGPNSFSLVMQWGVFCHLVDRPQWAAAVENMKRWAGEYILYVDKLAADGEPQHALSSHVKVWQAGEVIELMKPFTPIHVSDYELKSGYRTIDTFTVMLFHKPAERKPEKATAGKDKAVTDGKESKQKAEKE